MVCRGSPVVEEQTLDELDVDFNAILQVRYPIQETAFLVQIVLKMRFLVSREHDACRCRMVWFTLQAVGGFTVKGFRGSGVQGSEARSPRVQREEAFTDAEVKGILSEIQGSKIEVFMVLASDSSQKT
eukprot:2701918-Rhodomonas_salina.1